MIRNSWKLRLSAIAAVMFIVPFAAAYAAETAAATVININGRLDYRENDRANWKPAKKFDPLYEGYQLRTETGNKAMIVYNATSARVLINENTQIEVHSQTNAAKPKQSRDRTKLIMGEVYSKLKSGDYEVETPSSVASVRGTQFDSQYDLQTDTATYLVMESTVELMNQLGKVLLSQYQTASVPLNGQPGTPQQLSKGEAEKRTEWTGGVEPKWRVNMTPEGGTDHEMGSTFAIGFSILDFKTLTLDGAASFELRSFSVNSDIIEFSTDNGKTWTTAPKVRIVNGFATIKARVNAEGRAEITAGADDAEPAVIGINVSKVKDKKRIEIQFTLPDGKGQKTLILELEEK